MKGLYTSANSILAKIILGIVITSLIFTSMHGFNSSSNYVAKINGQEISRWQFENVFDDERSFMQHLLGDQFSELATNLGYMESLYYLSLNRLIDEVLLNQYAQKIGLMVSDEQIKNVIFATRAFHTNGEFDNSRYNKIISLNGLNPDLYVMLLRNKLTILLLINTVIGTDFILQSENDRLATLLRGELRVILEATLVDVNALAMKLQVGDNEVEDYYKKNKISYLTPEEFRIKYIMLDVAKMPENTYVASDSEIQHYYDQHHEQFIQAQRSRYSIIKTKTEDGAKAVLDLLNNGADFATIARTRSVDIISANNGGDIGWFEEKTTPKEIKKAGLKTKKQLSKVIKSSASFLIVRLDDILPAKIKSLSEVYEDIMKDIKQEKALNAYYALQQKIKDEVGGENECLVRAELVTGIKAVETGWFNRNTLPLELNFKSVADAIFNNNVLVNKGSNRLNRNSIIVTISNDRAFVLCVSEHKPESIKQLNVVKRQIVKQLKHNKALQQAKAYAEKLLSKLKKGKGNEEIKTAGLSFGPEVTLSRIGQDPISQAAFNLKPPSNGQPSYGVASDIHGNIILLALNKVKITVVPEDLKKVILLDIAQNHILFAFEALINSLRKAAKIKIGDIIVLR